MWCRRKSCVNQRRWQHVRMVTRVDSLEERHVWSLTLGMRLEVVLLVSRISSRKALRLVAFWSVVRIQQLEIDEAATCKTDGQPQIHTRRARTSTHGEA